MNPSFASTVSLKWDDQYLLGYEEMDALHEEFVDVVDRLQRCEDQDLTRHLDEFIEHAIKHFGAEDAWMRATDFPPRECHIDEHAAVMASAQEVRQRTAEGDVTLARAFAAELVRWFPSHVDHLDSALAHWMFKRRYGGKPVVLRRSAAHLPSEVGNGLFGSMSQLS